MAVKIKKKPGLGVLTTPYAFESNISANGSIDTAAFVAPLAYGLTNTSADTSYTPPTVEVIIKGSSVATPDNTVLTVGEWINFLDSRLNELTTQLAKAEAKIAKQDKIIAGLKKQSSKAEEPVETFDLAKALINPHEYDDGDYYYSDDVWVEVEETPALSAEKPKPKKGNIHTDNLNKMAQQLKKEKEKKASYKKEVASYWAYMKNKV